MLRTSPTPKALKNGNPLCWNCLRRLTYQRGGGFRFKQVVDPIGNTHRVHLDCLKHVLEGESGIKEVRT